MEKWADYLISEVVYGPNNLIFKAKRHQDTEKGISVGTVVDRLAISSDISNGKNYITVYSTPASWKKGRNVRTFRINGDPFIRIDNNKVGMDFLGDIPELQGFESELEQMSLELEDKVDEEPESSPEDEPPPEPTPTPESPRGSLPKDTDAELPQELELLPEDEPTPEPDDESTAEHLAQLDNLKSQLAELENSLTSIKLLAKTVSEQKIKETEPSYHEQLTQLDDSNSETITLDESPDQNGLPTQPKQKQKGAKSKKKIKSYDFKKETAQLKKHNKKLDQMQNKLKATESDRAEPSSKNTMAYCVKCKEKRLVANPQSTIMKNGRSAIKGTCSVCACKVFRIVKKQ